MTEIVNRTYQELEVGQSAHLKRRLTMDDLHRLAGDWAVLNPAHMDPRFATNEFFQRLITHGMWGTSLLATLVGTELPGPGTVVLEQSLSYGEPVAIGDTVVASVTVQRKLPGNEVVLEAECHKDGHTVVSGTLRIQAPTEKVRQRHEDMDKAEAGGRGRQLAHLLTLAEEPPPMRTAVVHPVDDVSLGGAVEAARRNLIVPVLIGPRQRIEAAAQEADLDLSGLEVVDTEHSHAAAERAVELARAAEVEAIMKGALHTDELMGAVVDKHDGLRTARRMSHLWVMDVPTYPRPLFITDGALNIAPDLETKRDIAQNAIEAAQALGVEEPRLAVLSATESVNPAIPSTLDAAALCKMADRGQIKGGHVDGPLAFDNAVSEAAADTKGIRSQVAGRADILLCPDLESANMLGKQLHYLADAESAGVVLGARVPIMLTSRADETLARLASCAVALLLAEHRRRREGVAT